MFRVVQLLHRLILEHFHHLKKKTLGLESLPDPCFQPWRLLCCRSGA